MSSPFPDAGSPFPYEPERKQRGCLFYGCIFAAVLLGLVALLVGLASWATYRAANQFVQQYAEDAPAAIPVVERPPDEVKAIRGRIDRFADDLASGKPTGPLELTADELNAIIASVPEFKGIAAVDLSGDAIRGKISLPLSRLGFPIGTLFGGKYLNGTATIDARVVDGHPVIMLVGLEAKGQRVPDAALASIRGQNLAEGLEKDEDVGAAVGRIESITVKGGKLILTPKPPAKPGEPARDAAKGGEAAKGAKSDEPAKEGPSKEAKPDEPVKAKDQPKPAAEPAAPK